MWCSLFRFWQQILPATLRSSGVQKDLATHYLIFKLTKKVVKRILKTQETQGTHLKFQILSSAAFILLKTKKNSQFSEKMLTSAKYYKW